MHQLTGKKTSHGGVLETTLPRFLQAYGSRYTGGITRTLPSVPPAIVKEARKFIPQPGDKDCKAVHDADLPDIVFTKRGDADFYIAYVNTAPKGRRVTMARIRVFRAIYGEGNSGHRTLESFRDAALTLEEVIIVKDRSLCRHEREGDSCTCADFWLWRVCAYLVAVRSRVFPHECGFSKLLAPAYTARPSRDYLRKH